jgi:hypothetical protein
MASEPARKIIDGIPWCPLHGDANWYIDIPHVEVYVRRRENTWYVDSSELQRLTGYSGLGDSAVYMRHQLHLAMKHGNRVAMVQARNMLDEATEKLGEAREAVEALTVQAQMLRGSDG